MLALSANLKAQTSIRGVDFKDPLPIRQGVYGWWRADMGLTISGTNSVQSWQDLTANKWNLSQYNTTNQPGFISAYTTNNLPSVYFTGTPPTHLFCDAVAPAFSGEDKPFSIIAVCVGQTNGNSCMPVSFGWGSSSNNNAAKKGMSINRPGSTTTSGTFLIPDTNSAAIAGLAYTYNFAGVSTNRAFVYTTTYDGQNGMLYSNLNPSTNLFYDAGPITVNQFTVGLCTATNHSFVGSASGGIWRGGLTEIQVYTNMLTGTQVSNIVNDIRTRYPVF